MANAEMKLLRAIQFNYDLCATVMAQVDGDTERAVSMLETAIMTLQSVRLPDLGRFTPSAPVVLVRPD